MAATKTRRTTLTTTRRRRPLPETPGSAGDEQRQEGHFGEGLVEQETARGCGDYQDLTGHVDNSSNPEVKVNVLLNLTTRADAKGPVPVIMELGFVLPPSGIPRERGRGPGPGAAPEGPTMVPGCAPVSSAW